MPRSIFAVVRITLSGLPARWPMALSSMCGIALVVAVLLGFLAMAEGFTRSLTGAGSANVAVIVGQGVRSEPMSALSPDAVQQTEAHAANAGIASDRMSAERVRVASARRADGGAGTVVLRGVTPAAAAFRQNRRTAAGAQPPMPRGQEVVLGVAAARQLGAERPGDAVRLAGQTWRVTALVESGGTALESEAWVASDALAAAFPGEAFVQSLRLPLAGGEVPAGLRASLTSDPRLSVRIEREDRFFAAQSAGLAGMLRAFAWPLAIVMGLGALAGALNTMFTSVAARTQEIATLRAIGFGPGGTFLATFAEALVLALVGGGLGVALAALVLGGRSGSTLAGGAAEVSFTYALTPGAVGAAFLFALLVGVLGGAWPAVRAARQPILAGLNSDAQ
jgi:putative ABC transport system permease protein